MIKILNAKKLESLDRHEGRHLNQGHHGRGVHKAITIGVGDHTDRKSGTGQTPL